MDHGAHQSLLAHPFVPENGEQVHGNQGQEAVESRFMDIRQQPAALKAHQVRQRPGFEAIHIDGKQTAAHLYRHHQQ